mgnify:CR=1 FL=1
MKRNWEQLMCNRNERIAKRKKQIEEIEAKTEALMTDKDWKAQEKNMIKIFPEIKNDPSLIKEYLDRFKCRWISENIKEKLGEKIYQKYNTLQDKNVDDEALNQRSLRRHKLL